MIGSRCRGGDPHWQGKPTRPTACSYDGPHFGPTTPPSDARKWHLRTLSCRQMDLPEVENEENITEPNDRWAGPEIESRESPSTAAAACRHARLLHRPHSCGLVGPLLLKRVSLRASSPALAIYGLPDEPPSAAGQRVPATSAGLVQAVVEGVTCRQHGRINAIGMRIRKPNGGHELPAPARLLEKALGSAAAARLGSVAASLRAGRFGRARGTCSSDAVCEM